MTTSESKAAKARLAARRAIVDELGDLLIATAPHKADFARLELLKKTVRDWFAGEDAAGSFTAEGDHYAATVGAKGNQTRIEDMDAVFQAMGRDAFLSVCAVPIGKLTPECVGFTVSEQTGPRPLNVTELCGD